MEHSRAEKRETDRVLDDYLLRAINAESALAKMYILGRYHGFARGFEEGAKRRG